MKAGDRGQSRRPHPSRESNAPAAASNYSPSSLAIRAPPTQQPVHPPPSARDGAGPTCPPRFPPGPLVSGTHGPRLFPKLAAAVPGPRLSLQQFSPLSSVAPCLFSPHTPPTFSYFYLLVYFSLFPFLLLLPPSSLSLFFVFRHFIPSLNP